MQWAIHWLHTVPLWEAAGLFLLQNILVFLLAVALGEWLMRRFAHRRVAPPALALQQHELVLAAVCVLLNSAVTFAGLLLWREGWIRFRLDGGPRVLVDLAVLVGIMDLGMYALHRVAHSRWLYGWLHAAHHRYEFARPLTLFVLNPLEVLGFGMLWLTVCVAYEASWIAMMLYLVFNTLWGVLGHLGVEPFPDGWVRWPVTRAVATTTFHARHHLDLAHHYGFYTLVWDRLFGTLAPDYEASFARSPTQPYTKV
ncbi:sterol desaturase family protein [Stigmatella sp. ncwal1]|uniref:Sterol desaturase family protein n=1 Tax=Stigmatella ashevillensis TaxID=2995309 RepID=A0ABT5DLE2_9BACT|nr:sterol desaturase family protein [Stigmatella ashevillena]MDC0713844.1 sterol desaturase family protein [Stigmatella ashevillena]